MQYIHVLSSALVNTLHFVAVFTDHIIAVRTVQYIYGLINVG